MSTAPREAGLLYSKGNCASTVVGVKKNCEAILVIVAAGRQFLCEARCVLWIFSKLILQRIRNHVHMILPEEVWNRLYFLCREYELGKQRCSVCIVHGIADIAVFLVVFKAFIETDKGFLYIWLTTGF